MKAKLAIEVDGEHHTYDEQREHDMTRDAYLLSRGIITHRIIARDLLMSPDETIAGVIDLTLARMTELGVPLPSASPPPSP